MKTKICSRCKVSLADHANGYCTPCNRAYGKKNYHQNKARYFAKAKERDQRMDELINGHKDKPCADCSNTYPPFVMDFDHLGNKEFNISAMRRQRMAFHKIEAEIAKCEVVCANCHRIRTNSRNPARYLKVALGAL